MNLNDTIGRHSIHIFRHLLGYRGRLTRNFDLCSQLAASGLTPVNMNVTTVQQQLQQQQQQQQQIVQQQQQQATTQQLQKVLLSGNQK